MCSSDLSYGLWSVEMPQGNVRTIVRKQIHWQRVLIATEHLPLTQFAEHPANQIAVGHGDECLAGPQSSASGAEELPMHDPHAFDQRVRFAVRPTFSLTGKRTHSIWWVDRSPAEMPMGPASLTRVKRYRRN